MTVRAALIQMQSGRDMARNFSDACDLIRDAAAKGARFITTPEMTNILEPDRPRLRALVRPEADDRSVAGFSAMASEFEVWLNIGSVALQGDSGKPVNRSLLFAPDGALVARYDKIHLFDVDLPSGESLRESEAMTGGSAAVLAKVPVAGLGLTICYDVRFPHLYRALALAGAQVFTVPSAFTVPTGEAHWHTLLRARAIETASFVLAAAQGGRHESGRETYGHSLAIGPWGEILVEGGRDPEVLIADVDLTQVEDARRRIPALRHGRRFELEVLNPAAGVASSEA